MSVINRMLQELEERHDDAAQNRLPGIVRAVPARLPRVRRPPWVVLVVGIAVLIPVLAWQVVAIRTNKSEIILPPMAITPPSLAIAEPNLKADDQLKPSFLEVPQAGLPLPTEPAPKAPPEKAKGITAAGTKQQPAKNPETTTLQSKVKPEPAVVKSVPNAEPVSTAGFKQESKEQRTDNRYREAISLISQGRLQEAQVMLEEMLRAEPRSLSARQALLGIYVENKRYAQAEQLLHEGLQLNLAPANQAMALARIQFERGDQTAALATLEKYAPQALGQGEYHGFHAALLQRVGRHPEAIAQFQAALKTHPNQSNWLMGLGISLQAEKRYPEAEHAYLRARAGNALAPDLQAFVEQRLRQVQQLR